jgi:uncharacterized protein (TIGR02246 family)
MKMMSVLFCAVSAVAMAASASAEAPAATPTALAIKQALDASAAAWSAGDLAKFMECYEHSPSTRYVSGNNSVEGYDAIAAMYTARFKKPGASYGKLTLELIDVKDVGPQYAYVVGRYHLKPDTGPEVSGLTTLLFHKVGGRWLINSDHSS